MYVENHEFMLEVDTDMPHVVFFTFNQPDEWDSPFNIYKPHSGFTLETQFYQMILIYMVKSTVNFKSW